MKKKAQSDIMSIGIVAVLVIIFIAVIWGLVSSATNQESVTDTASLTQNVPFNITLTGNDPQTLSSVTNGTDTFAASNYTDGVSDGYVTILDNETQTGTVYVTYLDNQVGYVTSSMARTVIGFVTALVAIGLLVYLGKGGKQ